MQVIPDMKTSSLGKVGQLCQAELAYLPRVRIGFTNAKFNEGYMYPILVIKTIRQGRVGQLFQLELAYLARAGIGSLMPSSMRGRCKSLLS